MIWPYFRTGSPVAIVGEGDLVPQPDRLADLDRSGRPGRRTDPVRDRPRRDRHVVVVPEDDRLHTLDRNGHRRPSLQPRN